MWNDYKKQMDKKKPSDEAVEGCAPHKLSPRAHGARKLSVVLAAVLCVALVVTVCLPVMLQRGITKLPGGDTSAQPNADMVKLPSVDALRVAPVEDYRELFSKIDAGIADREYYAKSETVGDLTLLQPGEAIESTPEGDGGGDYSETNTRVAGIDEADIIKTDGNYIYAVSSDFIFIIKIDNGEVSLSSRTLRISREAGKVKESEELYIYGDTMAVVTRVTEYLRDDTGERYFGYYGAQHSTVIEFYDISDRTSPVFLYSSGQSGFYNTSRMTGGTIYLITVMNISVTPDIDKPETFVPSLFMRDAEYIVLPEDIYIAKESCGCYTVITAINASDGSVISSKATLGDVQTVYCSEQTIYITSNEYVTEDNYGYASTKITSYSYSAGVLSYKASGSVPGTLLNEFSLDEHEGYLRVVTTYYSARQYGGTYFDKVADKVVRSVQCNCLYILNDTLQITGSIENIAEGERVYSVRFDGKTGYFVTFRQVDPLFTVDLSEVNNPVILSALKIPGFSQYMHPFGDGLLFGLGRDADEESGFAGCVKLSMFDVSDPTDVTEQATHMITNLDYSSSLYNHKSIIINAEKNLIMFPGEDEYFVYSYNTETKSFEQKAAVKLELGSLAQYNYGFGYYSPRGVYANGYLYVFGCGNTESYIASFDMNEYKITASLVLPELTIEEREGKNP